MWSRLVGSHRPNSSLQRPGLGIRSFAHFAQIKWAMWANRSFLDKKLVIRSEIKWANSQPFQRPMQQQAIFNPNPVIPTWDQFQPNILHGPPSSRVSVMHKPLDPTIVWAAGNEPGIWEACDAVTLHTSYSKFTRKTRI